MEEQNKIEIIEELIEKIEKNTYTENDKKYLYLILNELKDAFYDCVFNENLISDLEVRIKDLEATIEDLEDELYYYEG